MPYYSAATNGPTAGDEQPAIDVDAVDVSTGSEGGPASPWPQSAASKNSDKWGNFVSFGYLFISAVIMNNILYTFFPNGLGAAMVKPAALKITEPMIALHPRILAACDFDPRPPSRSAAASARSTRWAATAPPPATSSASSS